MSAGKAIADFIASCRYEHVSPGALSSARLAILDCLGVALAGSRAEDGELAAALVREVGASGESSVYGHGFRNSAMSAAFANGVAAHAEDFDHSFVVGGQPTAPVIPAVFALGESLGSSGKQVVEAYVTGFEVTAALMLSLGGAAGGWHAVSVAGVFGATAGCARLLGLDAAKSQMAIGMAASLASGVTGNFGTMTKPLHAGQAARNGVMAAKLAAAGYTANPEALEAKNGFYAAFYPGVAPDLQSFEQLGKTFALETYGIRIKPYPCGGLTHTAIDAAMKLRERHAIDPGAVASVTVDVMEGTYGTIVFQVPQTGIEGKFCMPYLISRALTYGVLGLDAFTDDAVKDEGVLVLAKKVEMRLDPSLQAGSGGARSARVSVTLTSGETLVEECNAPKGSPQAPMTDAEMESKFRECASKVLGEREMGQALAMIGDVEGLADVRELCGVLRGG